MACIGTLSQHRTSRCILLLKKKKNQYDYIGAHWLTLPRILSSSVTMPLSPFSPSSCAQRSLRETVLRKVSALARFFDFLPSASGKRGLRAVTEPRVISNAGLTCFEAEFTVRALPAVCANSIALRKGATESGSQPPFPGQQDVGGPAATEFWIDASLTGNPAMASLASVGEPMPSSDDLHLFLFPRSLGTPRGRVIKIASCAIEVVCDSERIARAKPVSLTQTDKGTNESIAGNPLATCLTDIINVVTLLQLSERSLFRRYSR